jgi:lauroyl/myristoyl acyltransferase
VVLNVPAFLHPALNWLSSFVFFFVAAPARKAVVRHLRVVLPHSSTLANYLRVFRVFSNFGWMLTDTAVYRLEHVSFTCELEGENFLRQLATAGGAIVLTAHMGNYDLGAALFAEKFQRRIYMVRAPEPDAAAAQHLDLSFQESTAGAVKVGYSNGGAALAFDLLSSLRNGEIISIQGDRVVGEVARSTVRLFDEDVLLPTGPFVLALAAEAPIYPLFIVRAGYRRYRIIAHEPILCARNGKLRDEEIAEAMQHWANVLEQTVRSYWPQWYAFRSLL